MEVLSKTNNGILPRVLSWCGYSVLFLLLTLTVNGYLAVRELPTLLWIGIPGFLTANLLPGWWGKAMPSLRLRICRHGAALLCLFLGATVVTVGFHVYLAWHFLPERWTDLLFSVLVATALLAVTFWHGIVCIYATSGQMRLKYRIIGLLCGLLPVVNIVALGCILHVVFTELRVEGEKEALNRYREAERICATRYPILLVHGVFFRDSRYFNYWGRIPEQLIRNGAKVYYGEQPSAASVAECGAYLARRIRQITEDTGCGKVHIIAHSKGGLDCRWALAYGGAAPYVASLTTVNTPHRGCLFADYLLEKAPADLQRKVAAVYNGALTPFEKKPDFLAAVTDLTAAACEQFDTMPSPPDVVCRSIGSVIKKATGGQFPLNYSYHLVKWFDGPNDGLVGEGAFSWGDTYTLLTVPGKRGISHGDMIDLNRENIPGFDVREFYVQLVADLKSRGM
ncbi:MAG: triacylglycerol lipase [Clostridia bacterium]|nr:triacylglycerol lipase [Clostridia bacterium]